jgi:hypothetical protein
MLLVHIRNNLFRIWNNYKLFKTENKVKIILPSCIATLAIQVKIEKEKFVKLEDNTPL